RGAVAGVRRWALPIACAAKDAETPPVHGSASTLTKGIFAARRRAIAALVFAICISESAPSCMRAPPEEETVRSGHRSASAASARSEEHTSQLQSLTTL